MVRVSKSSEVPASLLGTRAYDGEDVRRRLLEDQQGKCYICERICVADFEVEHLQSAERHPELRQDWGNLLLACGYCNRKKLQGFDSILNPLCVNVEDEIEQGIDYGSKKAVFVAKAVSPSHTETVRLLERVFNGTGNLRKIREERFFEYFLSVMNLFQGLLIGYLENPTLDNGRAVREELAGGKEFLGFKYRMIKGNAVLEEAFGDCVVWNKV